MLRVSRETSAERPLPDGWSLAVFAEEMKGEWEFILEQGEKPWMMIVSNGGDFHIRGAVDSVGPTVGLVIWRKNGREEKVRVFLGAGPKSVAEPKERWVEVKFTGFGLRGAKKYLVDFNTFYIINENVAHGWFGTYTTLLNPLEFEEKFCLKDKKFVITKVITPYKKGWF